ncbi:MAG: hypothetical protein Q4F18_13335 [Clostridia bacterium]|nr:hypothetical protein [Clostridia bacterium]
MKHSVFTLLLSAALLLGGLSAMAESATYVFPYEGFRYTQQENETVFTQTNLDEHEELIQSLGTTKEAVLASYIASGIVMEVIPDEGGQIAISVADAGDFASVNDMDELSDEELERFARQFADSGLYESCELMQTEPVCVRLTSSAMYASMPVYTLRYVTLHLGRLYMFTQTIVGREPGQEDDARIEQVLSGVKLLSSVSEATPVPTIAPTATPSPTPSPTPGVAEVVASEGVMIIEGVPAYTAEAELTIAGTTDPSAAVRVVVGEKTLATTTAKKDGTFSVKVTLPEEGDLVLAVMTDQAEAMLAVRYEMPTATLEITEPEETSFTGTNVTVRGVTEPNATVYITGKGMNTNVKAGKNGVFNVRIFMQNAETQTYTLRAKATGFKENSVDITLTRELTERESLTLFRQKMISLSYADWVKDPQKYVDRQFQFRGKVMEFTDYNGSPCALICVSNVSTGVWRDPVWVVLTGEEEIAVGDVVTFYLTGEGMVLPADGQYAGTDGEVDAPVARAAYWTMNK